MDNIFYVYLHKTKDEHKIFYVGKGCKKRAYSTSDRNELWKNIVKHHGFYVEFLSTNLTENDALLLEEKTINELGISSLTNLSPGGSKPSDRWYNSDTCRDHLKKISKLGGEVQGRRNVLSGQMSKIHRLGGLKSAQLGHLQQRASEYGSLGGKKSGRMNAESGHCKRIAAKRWGIETEPGLWISRKTNKVILDERNK